jgi:hypothetical protein
MAVQDSEEGSSTAVAFALAGVLFIGAISTVLVYTNDRIPPPAKTRPHEEYGSEAHVILQSLVLGCGNATWDPIASRWNEALPPSTTTSTANVFGLRSCTAAGATTSGCAGTICLNRTRMGQLVEANETAGTEPDSTYDYEDLRAILGLDDAERHLRIVVVDMDGGERVLLDFGEPIPGRTATQPATAYVELDDATGSRDGHTVRVAVHVFHS